jgi:hypothetical protein
MTMTTWTVAGRTFDLRWRPDMAWRIAAATLAALVVAGSVVALARADGDGSKAASSAAPPTTVAGLRLDDASGSLGTESGAGAVTGGAAAPAFDKSADERSSIGETSSVPAFTTKIVRTADLRVRVRGSFTTAVDRASAVAGSLGGFVTSSSSSSFERGKASAELTLRVPADSFDEARRRLSRLGRIDSLEVRGRDVGGQLVDLDARLRALRAEEGALELLLGKAGDIGQILQIRDRLTFVRTQVEQLDGQQAALRDQVAMSTLHVSLYEAGAPARSEKKDGHDRSGIAASARDALDAAEAVVGGMLIVLGAVSPLVGAALLAWFLYWVIARRRKIAPPA